MFYLLDFLSQIGGLNFRPLIQVRGRGRYEGAVGGVFIFRVRNKIIIIGVRPIIIKLQGKRKKCLSKSVDFNLLLTKGLI